MKFEIEFPDEALQAIAAAVADRLRPVIIALTAAPAKADELMSVEELAAYLGVSKDGIYRKTAGNEIPFVKVGRLVKFRRSEVDRWLSTRSVPDITSLSAPSPSGGRGIRNPVARQTDLRKRPLTGGMK